MKKMLVVLAAVAVTAAGAQESSDLEDAAGALGEAFSKFGEALGATVLEGIEQAGDAVEKVTFVQATGTVREDLFSKNLSLVTDDGTFSLCTLSGTEDSRLRLSGYKNREITVTGILNAETNEITLLTYALSDRGGAASKSPDGGRL